MGEFYDQGQEASQSPRGYLWQGKSSGSGVSTPATCASSGEHRGNAQAHSGVNVGKKFVKTCQFCS